MSKIKKPKAAAPKREDTSPNSHVRHGVAIIPEKLPALDRPTLKWAADFLRGEAEREKENVLRTLNSGMLHAANSYSQGMDNMYLAARWLEGLALTCPAKRKRKKT